MKSCEGDLIQQACLADYTSWRVGGKAKQLYKPSDLADLRYFLSSLPPDEPIVWLGLGSNVLIRDGGFPGTVIVTQGALKQLALKDDEHIYAEAGVACATLARYAAKSNLAGLEFMAGIPGTVGGALKMNAGCFNGETWEQVISVDTIDREGQLRKRTPDDFAVSYRQVDALFEDPEWFVAGYFKLLPGDKQQSLHTIRSLLDRRAATQPTGDHSCGSVFRNPEGDYAARLIESCGLKGFRHGGAMISEKHANFIINANDATAKDIEELIEIARNTVKQKHSIELQREVHILGND